MVQEFLKPPFRMVVYADDRSAPILDCDAYAIPPIGSIVIIAGETPLAFKVLVVNIRGEVSEPSPENPLGSPHVHVMSHIFQDGQEV